MNVWYGWEQEKEMNVCSLLKDLHIHAGKMEVKEMEGNSAIHEQFKFP